MPLSCRYCSNRLPWYYSRKLVPWARRLLQVERQMPSRSALRGLGSTAGSATAELLLRPAEPTS